MELVKQKFNRFINQEGKFNMNQTQKTKGGGGYSQMKIRKTNKNTEQE